MVHVGFRNAQSSWIDHNKDWRFFPGLQSTQGSFFFHPTLPQLILSDFLRRERERQTGSVQLWRIYPLGPEDHHHCIYMCDSYISSLTNSNSTERRINTASQLHGWKGHADVKEIQISGISRQKQKSTSGKKIPNRKEPNKRKLSLVWNIWLYDGYEDRGAGN